MVGLTAATCGEVPPWDEAPASVLARAEKSPALLVRAGDDDADAGAFATIGIAYQLHPVTVMGWSVGQAAGTTPVRPVLGDLKVGPRQHQTQKAPRVIVQRRWIIGADEAMQIDVGPTVLGNQEPTVQVVAALAANYLVRAPATQRL